MMLMYDLNFVYSEGYDGDNMAYEPTKIIIDNEVAISMAKFNKYTSRNRPVARGFHFMRQDLALNEHKFHWISTKYQLEDGLTKVG